MDKLLLPRLLSKNWNSAHWRILYYHGIEPSQRESFRSQLEWFGSQFNFVSLSKGVNLLRNNALKGPIMTLTFDDSDR